MAPVRHVSLFNCDSFLNEATRFVPQIDAGNYSPLIALVRTSLARYSGMNDAEIDQASPICIHGGVFPPEPSIPVSVPDARLLGEWIFTVLDQFLEMPRSFTHFASLNPILEALGWPAESIHLLIEGRPAFQLVKPELSGPAPKVVEYSDPYWFWLGFHGATSGWLNHNDVQVLLEQLQRDRDQILAFDIQQLELPGINFEEPIVRDDFTCGIRGSFDFLRERLALAKKRQTGIFQSLIYIQ